MRAALLIALFVALICAGWVLVFWLVERMYP